MERIADIMERDLGILQIFKNKGVRIKYLAYVGLIVSIQCALIILTWWIQFHIPFSNILYNIMTLLLIGLLMSFTIIGMVAIIFAIFKPIYMFLDYMTKKDWKPFS